MRNVFKFARPKGPGYGISSSYYLSILSSTPTLPPILNLINPGGDGGAVEGFGAPLAPDAPKDMLGLPLIRGAYAIASKDRKTVLKMLVFSKEEVGFDPELVASQSELIGVTGELLNRIRATWSIAQVRFEAHDPDVAPALDFALQFVQRFGLITEAAIADPLSERYLLPQDLFQSSRAGSVSAAQHIAVKAADGFVSTRGLSKFAQPELRLSGVDQGDIDKASSFLMNISDSALAGNLLSPNQKVGSFIARSGEANGGWSQLPSLELLPASGSMHEALNA